MADATGGTKEPPLRVTFDRRLRFGFDDAGTTSDASPPAYRKRDAGLGLTAMAASPLPVDRRRHNAN